MQEGDRSLDDESEAALEEAARIAALHLLRHRSSADLERTRRAKLFRAVLEGRVTSDALSSVLELATATRLTVVAVELVDPGVDDAAGVAVLADRAASLITLYCESYRRPAAVVAMGATVYPLVLHPEPADADRLVTRARGICDRACEALHTDVRAGIGRTVASVSELSPSATCSNSNCTSC